MFRIFLFCMGLDVLAEKDRSLDEVDPMRLFFPPALFFLLFSALWGLPILLRGDGVSVGTLLLFVTGLIFFFLGLLAEQLALIRKNLNLSVPKHPPEDN